MMKSNDKGSSWGAPKNMSSMCGRPGSMGYGLSGDTPSDGAGIQLTTGRLVVPMYAGIPSGRTICYSDDHGEKWTVAHTNGQDATEGEVVELFPENQHEHVGSDPTLLYTIRAGACTRAVSTSTDGGLSWSKAEVAPAPMNIDPGCVSIALKNFVTEILRSLVSTSDVVGCSVEGGSNALACGQSTRIRQRGDLSWTSRHNRTAQSGQWPDMALRTAA